MSSAESRFLELHPNLQGDAQASVSSTSIHGGEGEGDAPLCRSGKGAATIVGDVLATLRRMNPRAAFGAC